MSWRERRIQEMCTLFNGFPFASEDFADLGDIPLVRIRDLSSEEFETHLPSHVVPKQALLRNGDVVIGMDGAFDVLLWSRGQAALNQRLCALRDDGRSDLRFLAYALPERLKVINDLTYATTVKHLSSSQVLHIRLQVPELAAQRAIADYLDRETTLIDQLIEKQNALLERLRERRSGLILSAVTGAAEQDRKPANMGWTDSVPGSWQVLPLDYLAKITLGKMITPAPSSDRAVLAPYLRAANVQPDGATALDDLKEMWFEPHELGALSLAAGDVVVVEGGQGGFGRAAFISDDLRGVGFQNSINRLRPRASDGRFLAYALIAIRGTGYMHAYCDIVSMPHLTAEKLARLRMGAPCLEEQRDIADYLDSETAKIDELIAKVKQHIELAKERRSALITATVTGQNDVGAA